MQVISENSIHERSEQRAEMFFRQYRPQMEALEKYSPLHSHRAITVFDYCALGEQLQQFEQYAQFVSEAGTAADLGKLPQVALDVITAAYGASIIPLICSVQPIEEERGIIYYKQTKALNTRGNVSVNQIIRNGVAAPDVYPQGYAGELMTESLGNTADNDQAYDGTLANYPVRPNTVNISIAGTSFVLQDDGNGNLLGIKSYGTIVYSTGRWYIWLTEDPAATHAISATFGLDFEAGATIPKINTVTESDDIQAEIFVLGQEMGMFKSFSLKKRFGKMAEDEMIQDLTNELTGEIGNTAITRLTAVSVGSVDWNRNPSPGLSWFEHKQELKDVISRAEGTLFANAGRGVVNYIIAGVTACGILSNLPGFVKSQFSGSGPHVYGTLDGITIIRSPFTTTNYMYPVYKGTGFFDAPIVYSPYMPLFVTNTLPTPSNLLSKSGVAAVWAGLKVVVPQFCTRIIITST